MSSTSSAIPPNRIHGRNAQGSVNSARLISNALAKVKSNGDKPKQSPQPPHPSSSREKEAIAGPSGSSSAGSSMSVSRESSTDGASCSTGKTSLPSCQSEEDDAMSEDSGEPSCRFSCNYPRVRPVARLCPSNPSSSPPRLHTISWDSDSDDDDEEPETGTTRRRRPTASKYSQPRDPSSSNSDRILSCLSPGAYTYDPSSPSQFLAHGYFGYNLMDVNFVHNLVSLTSNAILEISRIQGCTPEQVVYQLMPPPPPPPPRSSEPPDVPMSPASSTREDSPIRFPGDREPATVIGPKTLQNRRKRERKKIKKKEMALKIAAFEMRLEAA